MLAQRIRAKLARELVKWASRWIQASYDAYVRVERDGFPEWYAKPWHSGSRLVNRYAIPLAIRLDRITASIQMIEESWWG